MEYQLFNNELKRFLNNKEEHLEEGEKLWFKNEGRIDEDTFAIDVYKKDFEGNDNLLDSFLYTSQWEYQQDVQNLGMLYNYMVM